MTEYRVFLPYRALIPPLIWKVYYSSSLGSVSSLLGPHGDDGSILMCRGQKLGIKQGIPLLLAFFFFFSPGWTFQACSWSLFDLSLSPTQLSISQGDLEIKPIWLSCLSLQSLCSGCTFTRSSIHPPPPYLAQPAIAPPRSLSDKHWECLEVIWFISEPSTYSKWEDKGWMDGCIGGWFNRWMDE